MKRAQCDLEQPTFKRFKRATVHDQCSTVAFVLRYEDANTTHYTITELTMKLKNTVTPTQREMKV
jgi:hypothetical protein